MDRQSSVAAIILGAGSSSRMKDGQHKLLLPLRGRPIIIHVLEAALASQAKPIYIILGNRAKQIEQCLADYKNNSQIQIITNEAYYQGMSSSLRTGIQAAQDDLEGEKTAICGALILLGDQPLITPAIINTLIQTRQQTEKLIIAPDYAGKRGNPVLFDKRLFPELLTITGDQGGRNIIEKYYQHMICVAFPHSKAYTDVDTWENYQQIKGSASDL